LRKTAQSASSPEGEWEEFGERRRAEAGSPEWDAGRELRQAARGQASRERDLLTMEPETTIRRRQRASGGESREASASTVVAGRREVALDAKMGRANERARGQDRAQSDTRGASLDRWRAAQHESERHKQSEASGRLGAMATTGGDGRGKGRWRRL
jgi:hypothetical protein